MRMDYEVKRVYILALDIDELEAIMAAMSLYIIHTRKHPGHAKRNKEVTDLYAQMYKRKRQIINCPK